MGEINTSDQIKKIISIIQERDNTILETDVKIKYYKDAIKRAEDEIKDIQKERKELAERDKAVDKQLEQVNLIKKCVKDSQETLTRSIFYHQTLEEMVAKEVEAKEKDTKRVREEFQIIYNEAKTELTENPRYKELEEARVEFLKVDIPLRQLQLKIRKRKRMIAQKAEIQKRIYYNFFVQMAEDYLTEKKIEELQDLKRQELEAIKKLYLIQEDKKMKQKLGTSGKIKSMANIIFGSQECHTEKSVNKPESPQLNKEPQLLKEKLNNMFQQEEIKEIDVPQKVRVLEHRVLAPAFVAPQFAVSKKRKTVNLTKKWQNIIKRGDSKMHISSSQQSDKCSLQSSQQSQMSQKSQEIDVYAEMGMPEQSLGNQPIEFSKENNESIQYSQDRQKISLTQTIEQVPIQYQMVESLNKSENVAMKIGDKPLTNLPTTFTDQPIPTSGIMKPRESEINKAPSKQEMPFGESNKSVRFNLGHSPQRRESKGLFGQSMFGNPFESFFGRTPTQNAQNDDVQQGANTSTCFNASLVNSGGENSGAGMDFDAGGNQSYFKSPECSYALEGEDAPSFKPPEMTPFGGGGGFFSFGSKSMFPFQ